MADPRDITAPHVHAVAALLAAAGYPVHVAEVTATDPLAYPYLVLWPDPGQAVVSSLAADSGHRMWTWQVTAVGRDWMETATALDRAKAALLGATITAPGRGYGTVDETVTGQPIRADPTSRDPSTGRPVFFGIAQFEALSTAAG